MLPGDEHREEAVLTIVGVLVNKDLPPVKVSKLSDSQLSFVCQQAELVGLGDKSFEDGLAKILEVLYLLDITFEQDTVMPWVPEKAEDNMGAIGVPEAKTGFSVKVNLVSASARVDLTRKDTGNRSGILGTTGWLIWVSRITTNRMSDRVRIQSVGITRGNSEVKPSQESIYVINATLRRIKERRGVVTRQERRGVVVTRKDGSELPHYLKDPTGFCIGDVIKMGFAITVFKSSKCNKALKFMSKLIMCSLTLLDGEMTKVPISNPQMLIYSQNTYHARVKATHTEHQAPATCPNYVVLKRCHTYVDPDNNEDNLPMTRKRMETLTLMEKQTADTDKIEVENNLDPVANRSGENDAAGAH
ncbi:hypothetical protein C8R44DRAFT_723798 [Mycena epipterygia]|nr:hypothetical protein C8R44DRAFT_723798 [Mycena epipterygia]